MTGVEGSPPVQIYASASVGLPQSETTFASVLKKAGYATGTCNICCFRHFLEENCIDIMGAAVTGGGGNAATARA